MTAKEIRNTISSTLLVTICLCSIQRSWSEKRHMESANIEIPYNCRRSSNPALSGDFEWEEMVATNPYPALCSSEEIRNKMALRLCILELLWRDQIASVMPRMTQRYNNFDSYSFFRVNMMTPPAWNTDCFTRGRGRHYIRVAPTDCYAQINNTFTWLNWNDFFKYISNDLRFLFDFVLYDETAPDFYMESKLWYLILYLKAMATEMPNPYWIVKLVKATAGEQERFDGKVLQAQQRLHNLNQIIKESHRNILQATKDVEVLVVQTQTASALRKTMH